MLITVASCGRIGFDEVCPTGYVASGPSCYRAAGNEIPGNGLTWYDAEADCEATGGHLAIVASTEDAIDVRDAMAPIEDWFIGGTDLVADGVYLTVTNESWTYLDWLTGQPTAADDCLMLDMNLKLKTGSCTMTDDYLCELDGVDAVPAAYGR